MRIYNFFVLIFFLTSSVQNNCMNCDTEMEYFIPSKHSPLSSLSNYKSPISLALARLHSTTPVEFKNINKETQKRIDKLSNDASQLTSKRKINKIYNKMNEYKVVVGKISPKNIDSLEPSSQERVLTPQMLATLFEIKKDNAPFIAEILDQQYKYLNAQSSHEEKRIFLKDIREEVYKMMENAKKIQKKIIDSEDIAYNPLIDLTTSLEAKFERIKKELQALHMLYYMKTDNILEIKQKHQSNRKKETRCSPTPTPTIIIHNEFISPEPETHSPRPIAFSSAAPDNAIHPKASKQ